MKRSSKYVALDVHQATTTAAVRERNGRVIHRAVLPTEATALVEFFRGMRGSIHVIFEEGTQAQWRHDLLVPVVEQVVVCGRRGERRGNKSDRWMRIASRSDSSAVSCERSTTAAVTG